MNAQVHQGFQTGSGVDPAQLKLAIQLLGGGVVLITAAWLVLQILVAFKDQRIETADAVWGTVKTGVIAILLLFVVTRF